MKPKFRAHMKWLVKTKKDRDKIPKPTHDIYHFLDWVMTRGPPPTRAD